jgi:DNA-binding winged helix-turn-helix (wHTH) protein/TolB-like protein/Flp pilus assembly protein TadD
MSNEPQELFEFGPFRFDTRRPRLTRDGEVVALTPKALEVLAVLVQSDGELVEKDVLIRRVWPDTFVEDGNLSVHIFNLRRALGQSPGGQNYIETIPRQGFRFTAAVQKIDANGIDLVVEHRTRSRVTIQEIEGGIEKTIPPETVQRQLPGAGSTAWRPVRVLGVAVSVLLLGGLVGGYFLMRGKSSDKKLEAAAVHSIAVLPFKSLSPGADDEYLRVGVADALITKLGTLRQIVVRPTSAIQRYVDTNEDPQSIGRALGVQAVLDGHLQRDGDRIRATAQLVSVRDGSQIWAGRFDDVFTNIFAVQDSISDQVVHSLSIDLTPADAKLLARRATQNTEAYRSYLLGRHFVSKRTDSDNRKAIDYFKQAIDQDPLYGSAYAGLAEAYTLSSYYSGVPPREAFPKAKAAAEKALETDETLVEAQTTLAYVKFIYDWDFQGAEKDFQKSFQLNPNYAPARYWYGECLMYLGRFVEGLAQINRAQELDPLSLVFSSNLGWAYHIARQDDQAIAHLQKVIESDRSFHMAYFYLGMAYESKGMYNEAIDAYQKSRELSGGGGYPGITGLGHAYAMSGQRDQALKILTELEADVQQTSRIRSTAFAIIFAGLNDHDKAFEWLEKAYEQKYEGVIFVKVQPYYDTLRSDPRYFDLLKRVGLTP